MLLCTAKHSWLFSIFSFQHSSVQREFTKSMLLQEGISRNFSFDEGILKEHRKTFPDCTLKCCAEDKQNCQHKRLTFAHRFLCPNEQFKNNQKEATGYFGIQSSENRTGKKVRVCRCEWMMQGSQGCWACSQSLPGVIDSVISINTIMNNSK